MGEIVELFTVDLFGAKCAMSTFPGTAPLLRFPSTFRSSEEKIPDEFPRLSGVSPLDLAWTIPASLLTARRP